MVSSRKFCNLSSVDKIEHSFERAIGEFLSRVCISACDNRVPIAVAYSGGLDSTVLLHLASGFARARNLPLHAFHVHHGLSPNADAWAAHCRTECERIGVRFDVAHVEIADAERHGVEHAARIARYRALGELCRKYKAVLLLTAHHQDDQAETVFLQLMRGAGLPGLSGMPAFQERHELLGRDIALGRPLLAMSRHDLEEVAKRDHRAYIIDESNADIRYRRNALRHSIAPAVEAQFPGFAQMVARSASHIQTAQMLLADLAAIDHDACHTELYPGALSVSGMRSLSVERGQNLLRFWLGKHGVPMPSTTRLQEIYAQLMLSAPDAQPLLDFGDRRLCRLGDRVELHPNVGIPPCEQTLVQWHGEHEIAIPEWQGKLIFDDTAEKGFDVTKLRSGVLTLRPRSGQERIKLAANRPSRTLKNLFQEAQIAVWRRPWLPLLYLDHDLVFVAGLGMDIRHVCTGQCVAVRWQSSQAPAL